MTVTVLHQHPARLLLIKEPPMVCSPVIPEQRAAPSGKSLMVSKSLRPHNSSDSHSPPTCPESPSARSRTKLLNDDETQEEDEETPEEDVHTLLPSLITTLRSHFSASNLC